MTGSIHVASRRKKPATIQKEFGEDCVIIDVTSKAEQPWVKFSPFYPHGDIPVPFTDGVTAASVEGIWQGLKVFESADVCEKVLQNDKMKGIKRTVRRFGKVRGHRKGLHGQELLPYLEARKAIYLPSYQWVLDNKMGDELQQLRDLIVEGKTVVLLDYETNCDIEDTRKPLSHAGLVLTGL